MTTVTPPTAPTARSSSETLGEMGDGFAKPGPGTWNLDTGHFGADSSRICQDLITIGCTEGTAEGFAMIGAPLKEMQARFVRGRFYHRLVPLVGGGLDLPTPPNAALWLATRLHPAFRRAEKTAEASIENRIWLDEYRRWNDEWKPNLIAESRRLSGIEPKALTDVELADHLGEVYQHALYGTRLHFRLHISDLGPIGLLLVRAREWGLETSDVMMALAGRSPATNAPGEALGAIRRLLATSGSSGANAAGLTALDDVARISTEAGERLDAFTEEFGWRLTTGYDIRSQTLAEMPAAILAALNATGDDLTAAESNEEAIAVGDTAFDALRGQVPPDARGELERLVADARDLYGLRDENGPLTYEWPAGLIRRAVLIAGDRLHTARKLPPEVHANGTNDSVFDLSATELSALLRGGSQPSRGEIGERSQVRRDGRALGAPASLGPEEPEPPVAVMPTNMRRLLEVVLIVQDLLEEKSAPLSPTGHNSLLGTGIGATPYVGRACIALEADDAIASLEPGDILVAPYTVPTFNSVLAIAGAVVTDSGGLLCHAAVIAREYGIAAVVGTGTATSRIPNGARISVDPATGTVTVLE